jgi:hypothetical protein
MGKLKHGNARKSLSQAIKNQNQLQVFIFSKVNGVREYI